MSDCNVYKEQRRTAAALGRVFKTCLQYPVSLMVFLFQKKKLSSQLVPLPFFISFYFLPLKDDRRELFSFLLLKYTFVTKRLAMRKKEHVSAGEKLGLKTGNRF